jgi:hypothetical protein
MAIAQDAVIAIAAKDVFNPCQAVSAIRAGTATRAKINRDRTSGRAIAGPISPIAANQRVIAKAAIERVASIAAEQAVIIGAAKEALACAPAGNQRVIPGFAREDLSIAVPALQAIGIGAAIEGLIDASARDQRVITIAAN